MGGGFHLQPKAANGKEPVPRRWFRFLTACKAHDLIKNNPEGLLVPWFLKIWISLTIADEHSTILKAAPSPVAVPLPGGVPCHQLGPWL